MGIVLAKDAREQTMEHAIREARRPRRRIDAKWQNRTEQLSLQIAGGDAKGKTYVAALGAALLAKATDDRVDAVTQQTAAGPRGFYLRGVAEDLQKQVRGTVHLGTLSKNPLNNKPFNGGGPRIDRFVVAGYLRHVYDSYLDWLRELDTYNATQAFEALVAFTKVRMKAQQAENRSASRTARVMAAKSVSDLIAVTQQWMTDDPEEGARCQAVTGAVLDLVWPDIQVFPKHHPSPFDVVRTTRPPALVCECKQATIAEADVMELVRRANEKKAPRALYFAGAVGQRPLAVERLRTDALDKYGVVLDVVYSVEELAARICVHTGASPDDIAQKLPVQLTSRCPQADVSAGGLKALVGLLAGV